MRWCCAAIFLAVTLLTLGCGGGSSFPPLTVLPLGTGLLTISPPDPAYAPTLTVLAERTLDQAGQGRAVLYGVSGRFTRIENSLGTTICGPGIGALIYVDPVRKEILRTVAFGDPGAWAGPPLLLATAVAEDIYSVDLDYPRPPRVVVTVGGIFAGVDAGPAGRIDSALCTGAVATFDLNSPDPVNVVAFDGRAADAPLVFWTPATDLEGLHARVSASGHAVRARDLRGFDRQAEGGAVELLLDLRSTDVEELSFMGGIPIPPVV